MYENLYEIIKAEAKKKGMTITQLEKDAGLAKASLCKWSKSTPTLSSMSKVADALGIKLSTLIERINKR